MTPQNLHPSLLILILPPSLPPSLPLSLPQVISGQTLPKPARSLTHTLSSTHTADLRTSTCSKPRPSRTMVSKTLSFFPHFDLCTPPVNVYIQGTKDILSILFLPHTFAYIIPHLLNPSFTERSLPHFSAVLPLLLPLPN